MTRENFRYFSILDGSSLTNEDETALSPRYYGYTRPGGTYIIMRLTDNAGIISYDFSTNNTKVVGDLSDYDADWGNRAILTTYRKAGQFKSL